MAGHRIPQVANQIFLRIVNCRLARKNVLLRYQQPSENLPVQFPDDLCDLNLDVNIGIGGFDSISLRLFFHIIKRLVFCAVQSVGSRIIDPGFQPGVERNGLDSPPSDLGSGPSNLVNRSIQKSALQ